MHASSTKQHGSSASELHSGLSPTILVLEPRPLLDAAHQLLVRHPMPVLAGVFAVHVCMRARCVSAVPNVGTQGGRARRGRSSLQVLRKPNVRGWTAYNERERVCVCVCEAQGRTASTQPSRVRGQGWTRQGFNTTTLTSLHCNWGNGLHVRAVYVHACAVRWGPGGCCFRYDQQPTSNTDEAVAYHEPGQTNPKRTTCTPSVPRVPPRQNGVTFVFARSLGTGPSST